MGQMGYVDMGTSPVWVEWVREELGFKGNVRKCVLVLHRTEQVSVHTQSQCE